MTTQARKEKNNRMWLGVYKVAEKNNCTILMEAAKRKSTLATEQSKLGGTVKAIL